jgi:aerobic-type carbon monoxide dehydrogenase small subunit (CoxS/CutS family)
MAFSRRHFLKAAGQGIALTAIGVGPTRAASAFPQAAGRSLQPLALPPPITHETATFFINGTSVAADYEARTTLWEVVAVKLGLTGTNRSCNKASCGACSVLVDGVPLYSCHTLAMEAAGKKVLTIEGVGSASNLHVLQRIGHTHVAADCGFCTAGWVVTAKGLLDRNRNPSEEDVKAALAGHICRCSAYPAIIRTVLDSAAVLRGEAERQIATGPESIVQIKLPMVRDYSTHGGHTPGRELVEGARKTLTKKWQGYPPENLSVIGKSMPALPAVSIPRFTGKAEYASRVRFPDMLHARFLTCPHPHARIRGIDTSAAETMPGVAHVLTYRNAPRPDTNGGNAPTGFRVAPDPLPRELNLQGEVVAIVAADTEDRAADALEAITVDYEVLPFVSTLKEVMAPGAPDLRGRGSPKPTS